MSRSFRLVNPRIGDNVLHGRFVYWAADIEYRKDDIHKPKLGRVSVAIPVEFTAFAGGADRAKPLLCHYAIQKLTDLLSGPSPELMHELQPSEEDFNELITLDSSRIDPNQTVYIDDALRSLVKKIFISCGQSSVSERSLGQQIKTLVDRNTGFQGYFAENQQSLDGLTKNIFEELNSCSGLITVMHRRESLSEDKFRASVWIEQEIAIAAFRQHVLGRVFPVKSYIQNGVQRDGVRQIIQLNPITFEADQEVAQHIGNSLASWLALVPA